MYRVEFRAMGSKILVLADGEADLALVQQVEVWFGDWERTLSRFRLDSELTRLNAAAGTSQPVSETLWGVYQAALDAQQWTDGLVNPLVLNALTRAGYAGSFDEMSAHAEVDVALRDFGHDLEAEFVGEALPALSSLVTHSAAREICVPEGAGLDFGGIAKGWAAHQTMLKLRQSGAALVSAGGDIAFSGPMADGEPWAIDVEDPLHPGGFIETIFLDGGGVATSGKDHRNWYRDGVRQHHVIDPRTGYPAQTDVLTATVIAPTVMRAEALAKAALISGSDAGLAWLEELEGVDGLLVLESGELLYTGNFEKYL